MSKIRLSGSDRKKLAATIKADIDAFCVSYYTNEHRNHLGSSEIGEKCHRKLWYVFRWMHREQFDGRLLRLFNRGHQTETRIIEWLRGIEAEVWSHADNGEQFHIDGTELHFGGSLDGIVRLPKRYNLDIPFLAEFKTHNLRNFTKLVKQGVILSHPKHFAQMNTYGCFPMYNFDYALYFGLCKNDDELHVEVVQLDHEAGRKNFEKAATIITSQTAPYRIAASPVYEDCVYCGMQGICHRNEPIDVNCRSCTNAIPIQEQNWYCKLHTKVLAPELIKTGCPQWKALEH
jgi:hypothetical protein